jgi:hypothetical protein
MPFLSVGRSEEKSLHGDACAVLRCIRLENQVVILPRLVILVPSYLPPNPEKIHTLFLEGKRRGTKPTPPKPSLWLLSF